ncbi:AcrR family transcriptional regulator [Nocardioides luteus]|uniref:TetR family transcriptional regulator n=1 Tax=Nocardioides luteus TaxID=1844 RepID=A0ABQ5SVW8_9ACTN|nr:TetR/AcrR family transcriptional regulator [Nocardioides luteus]MDR7309363.1 AcrR family transcriptional regulator [Nocardioides luteus]GLJ67770.1 TetR family transcriptional regulator [Nocardioides luteus]
MARPRSFDEDRVLHELRDRFWDAGYSATSLQDLMRISGLGKGSLYAAYGDKHSLFLRTLRTYVTEGNEGLRATLESEPRAVDALRKVLLSPVNPGAERGCFLANSTCELATQHADVRAEARQAYETMTELITACVAKAQQEGDLPADQDAKEFARSLLAAQQGVLYMGRTGMDLDMLRSVANDLADRLLPR